jgi:AcrR family transcriptional regulator
LDDQPAGTGTGRRRRNPEATREDIIAAARTVLASDGPDGLSLSKVAHLAGVNRGTTYQHFDTREDLIKATVESVSRHLSRHVLGGTDGVDRLRDPDQPAIYEAVLRLAQFAVDNPELGSIWLFEILSCEDPDEDEFFKHFKQSADAMSKSELSEEGIDTEVLSVFVLAGCFLWPVWVRARARSNKERKAMARRMSREILRLSLHGTMRAEALPELEQLLETLKD